MDLRSILPSLQPRLLLGLKSDIYGNAQFLSDEDVVYPVGSVIAVHNVNEKKQKYIKLAEKGKNLTHIAVSPNKKYVAVAESNTEKLPVITLWDPQLFKKKRTLTLPTDKDIIATNFSALTFSYDSKNLFCVTGDPDWTLYVFKCDSGKLLSSARANNLNGTGVVKVLDCNPNDVNTCVVVGDSLFRILAFETQWKQFGWNKSEAINFTAVCWISQERILAGTNRGMLVIFENGELKMIFQPSDESPIDLKIQEEAQGSQASLKIPSLIDVLEAQSHEIKHLVNFPRGFIFSYDKGKIYMYEKETPTRFKKKNIFIVPNYTVYREYEEFQESLDSVNFISINPSCDRILVSTLQCQMYTARMWLQDISNSPQTMMQEYGYMMHYGPIGGISVCKWKTICITSGRLDRTLKIWNYETEEMELMQRYEDDISSVALHPSGLYAVVGFTDKLRYFNIMIDDMKLTKEFPIRNCKLVSFSNMGHLFAAANANTIQVYSSIEFNLMYVLKGHSGKVLDMSWSGDDRILATCGIDGSVYEWDVVQQHRINECFIKSNPFRGVALTKNAKSSYAVGDDGRIREIMASNIQRDVPLTKTSIDAMALSQLDSMLFVTSNAVVYTIKIPLLDKAEFMEYVMHSENIEHMVLSFDDRCLVTGSIDGTICFWKVGLVEGKTIKLDPDFQPSQEILISKSILEERINKIKDLQIRLKELETEHAYQMRQSDAIHSLRMKDVHAAYCGAIEDLKEKNDKMDINHTKVLNKIHEEIALMEKKHDEFVKKLEASYNEKLIVEYEKYVALEERLKNVRMNFQKELEELTEAKKDSEETITLDFLEKLKDKEIQYEELMEASQQKTKEHEIIKQQIEDDADREIYAMKTKHETELKQEQDMNVRLRGESSLAKKKQLASQKEIEELNHQMILLNKDLKKYKNIIMDLERDILDLKKEVAERDQTIEDKERRIFQLQSKNQELEKFKFILDFKIKELKSQIEPRERTIMEQTEQINEMVGELEKLQRAILNMNITISDLKEKHSAANNEVDREVVKNRKMKDALQKIRVDIHNCSGLIQNVPMLIKAVKDMYHKHNANVDFALTQAEDSDVKNEFMRQRDFLERTASKLQKQAIKNTNMLSSDKVRLVDENVQLLMEANKLRKHLKGEMKQNRKMKSLLGLTKYMLPSQAQKKMEVATATREEIHEKYKRQLQEKQVSLEVLQEEKTRLLRKLTDEHTEIVVDERAIEVPTDY